MKKKLQSMRFKQLLTLVFMSFIAIILILGIFSIY